MWPLLGFLEKKKLQRNMGSCFCGLEPNQIFTPQAVAQSRKISSRTPSVHREKMCLVCRRKSMWYQLLLNSIHPVVFFAVNSNYVWALGLRLLLGVKINEEHLRPNPHGRPTPSEVRIRMESICEPTAPTLFPIFHVSREIRFLSSFHLIGSIYQKISLKQCSKTLHKFENGG